MSADCATNAAMRGAFAARAAIALMLSLCVCLANASFVRAQQPSQEARYRQLVDEAVSEFAAGRWGEALALFRAAHDVLPSARTLRGIGMAAFEMRDYLEARRSLEQALTDQRRALTPEQRAEVQRLVERARTFTARFRLRASPPEARLTVDGAAPSPEPDGSILLPIGTHEIGASMPGYRAARRQVVVRGGEDEELLMPLEADSGSTGGAETPDPDTVEGLLDRSDRTRRRRARRGGGGSSAVGIGISVTGGALLVGGLVSAIVFVRAAGELEDCRDAREGDLGMFCSNEPDLESNRDLTAGLTIGLGAAGLVGVATGVVLIVTSGGDDGDEAAIRCMPGLGGVSCAGRF